MTNDEPTKVSSTRIGTLKIPYSTIENQDSQTCQNCSHPYKDHLDKNAKIIPCQSCEEEPCENFQG